MDFKTFSEDHKVAKSPNSSAAPSEKITESKVREALDSVKGMSENEIMSEIFKRAAKGKADGTFNPEALKKAAENVRPMLTPEQCKKLDDILGALL